MGINTELSRVLYKEGKPSDYTLSPLLVTQSYVNRILQGNGGIKWMQIDFNQALNTKRYAVKINAIKNSNAVNIEFAHKVYTLVPMVANGVQGMQCVNIQNKT